ncbi:SMP-30/gluconolactonase/LRE family protein [Novosphingobium sp. BL-8H]|uniref:SMP-30/gluconolactonase/LRE family protein n=1 Tax=Novosphingobium sp. BL-8H TaxID=3127640 RepID=UPI003757DC27
MDENLADRAVPVCNAIAAGIYLEGLAFDHDRDAIWYSDVIGGGIHGVRPDGTAIATLNPARMWTGGVMMNADGCVLSSGQGGIMWNDPVSGRSGWLIDTLGQQPVNGINEMVSDGAGGILFGTIDIASVIAGTTPETTEIYRLTADRHLVRVADGIGFSNGVMFDPARRHLYCNDTFRGTWRFDLAADFSVTDRRLLLEKEDADGMALDSAGNLWLTGFRSRHLTCLDPDGAELARLDMEKGSITQLRFGGPDMRDLYFNSVPADGGDTLKEGGEITARNSHLYRTRAPVAGMRLEPARFVLG